MKMVALHFSLDDGATASSKRHSSAALLHSSCAPMSPAVGVPAAAVSSVAGCRHPT